MGGGQNSFGLRAQERSDVGLYDVIIDALRHASVTRRRTLPPSLAQFLRPSLVFTTTTMSMLYSTLHPGIRCALNINLVKLSMLILFEFFVEGLHDAARRFKLSGYSAPMATPLFAPQPLSVIATNAVDTV